MDNKALERRAREVARRIVGEFRHGGWPAKEEEIANLLIRTFEPASAEMREACAKVAEEHADSCAQARGNAGAFNDRHAMWQAEAERMASLNIAAAIRSLPDALPLPGEGDGEKTTTTSDEHPLARAVREARGGDAPITKKGFA